MQFNPQTSECKIFFLVPPCFTGKIDKIETDHLNLLIHSIDGHLLVVDKSDSKRTVQLDNVCEYKTYPCSIYPLFLFVDNHSVMYVFDSKSHERYAPKDLKVELNKVHYDNLSNCICVLSTKANAQKATHFSAYSNNRSGTTRGDFKEWQVIFEHQFMQFNRRFELVDISPTYEIRTTQNEFPIEYSSESFDIGDSTVTKQIPIYESESRPFAPSTQAVSLCALEVFGNYYFCHHVKLDGKHEENIIFLRQNQSLSKVLAHKSRDKDTWLQNGTYLKIDRGLRVRKLFSNSVYVANLILNPSNPTD
jgi:hypothetical protein